MNELPFVSTFEGPDNSEDWTGIRAAIPIFFVPDWTSVGPDAFKANKAQVTDGACTFIQFSLAFLFPLKRDNPLLDQSQ